jgi:hypothetical protein
MPRFDPSYIVEHDSTRLREAQHALVNARGHYLGAAPLAVSRSAPQLQLPKQLAPAIKDVTPAQKRQAIKANTAKIVAEFRAKGVTNITVNSDGTLHLKDFASDLDAAARALLNVSSPTFKLANNKVTAGPPGKPVDVINALPLSAEQKRALTQTPFSTAFNAATAIITVLSNPQSGVIPLVLKKTGTIFDLSTFPFNVAGGTRVDISLVQPGDELFDEVSQAKMLRLRTMTALVVLFWRKWAELHAELLKQGLDWIFAKEDVVLRKTTGTDLNKPEEPHVVDRIPGIPENAIARNLFRREGTFNGKVVFAVQIPATTGSGATSYYTLSPKGLLDRALEMRRQWDAKYEAYKNDKITNAAGVVFYGPRMTFLRSQGRTETQARNIIASEDNFPAQFQKTGDRRFIVLSDRLDLGGGLDRVNGPRPSDAFINRLRTAAAAPVGGLGNYVRPTTAGLGATGVEEFAAVMAAIESFCVAVGPGVVTAIIGGAVLLVGMGVGATYLIIMAAMGKDAFFFLDVQEGKFGAGQADDLPDEAFIQPGSGGAPSKGDEGGSASGQSTETGKDNTLLIAGVAAAALIGLMAMRKT